MMELIESESGLTRNKPTDFQVLTDLFSGKVEEKDLTAHQAAKLERYKAIYAMLLKAQSTHKIIKKIQGLYNLSESQISRDINLTERLFGGARQANKDFKRIVAEEMALATYRLALKNGDVKGMAAANKNYFEATGCGIVDPDLPDFERLKPSPNIVIIPKEILDAMARNLNTGPVKWRPNTDDTINEFEDVDSSTDGAD